MVQVLEGPRCFGHLTVEENIIAGAYSRKLSKADLQVELDHIYSYFQTSQGSPQKSQAGLHLRRRAADDRGRARDDDQAQDASA